MTQKSIDIRKGDQFGYMSDHPFMVQERKGKYAPLGLFNRQEWEVADSTVIFRPVPDSVARVVLAATGYTVVEVPEETRVEDDGSLWRVRLTGKDGYMKNVTMVVGTKAECVDFTSGSTGNTHAVERLPMPDPPPHPTVIALAKAMVDWMNGGSREFAKLHVAAQAVVDAGGKQ